jgi:hypothetical protein
MTFMEAAGRRREYEWAGPIVHKITGREVGTA